MACMSNPQKIESSNFNLSKYWKWIIKRKKYHTFKYKSDIFPLVNDKQSELVSEW